VIKKSRVSGNIMQTAWSNEFSEGGIGIVNSPYQMKEE